MDQLIFYKFAPALMRAGTASAPFSPEHGRVDVFNVNRRARIRVGKKSPSHLHHLLQDIGVPVL